MRVFSPLLIFPIAVYADKQLHLQKCSPQIPNVLSISLNPQCDITPGASQPSHHCDAMQWTQHPVCHHGAFWKNRKLALATYCLFTNTAFAAGRGISFITTPEIASSLTAAEASLGHVVGEDERRLDEKPLHVVKRIQGKGRGVVANRTVEQGTTIMIQKPVLVFAQGAYDAMNKEDRLEMQRKAFRQLPERTQKMIKAMARGKGEDLVDDVIATNALQQAYGDYSEEGWEGHNALFPEVGRINHACRQNAYYRCKGSCLQLEVFTLSSVQRGDEITFSYGYSEEPLETRITEIREKWGFTCRCPLCSAKAEVVVASNKRLRRLGEIHGSLSKSPKPAKIIKLITETLKIMKAEGLILNKGYFEDTLARTYAERGQEGDEVMVKYWARRAKKDWEIVAGKGSIEAKEMEDLFKDPKSHPIWAQSIAKDEK